MRHHRHPSSPLSVAAAPRASGPMRVARAVAAASLTLLAAACSADNLDTGPQQAQVRPAPVYEPSAPISTRSGAAVPMGDAPVTEDADRIAASRKPVKPIEWVPDGARMDGQAVVLAPSTTMPTTEPTEEPQASAGAMQDTYDADNPPQAGAYYDSGGYGGSGGDVYVNNYYNDPYYNGYAEDYWYDRSYWLASPYYYNNYVRFGYGYYYPYSHVDGRRYYYRNYNHGDRYVPRAHEHDWNDRARNRDRDDRTPRFPYTNTDRDGNGIDDRRDDGNRPTRDAGEAYRRQQIDNRPMTVDEQQAAARRYENQRQSDFARQQQDDVSGRRSSAGQEAAQRRAENRAAVESRRDAGRDGTPRSDAPRAVPAPSRSEAAPSRSEAPRRAEPARSAAPARSEAPRRAEPSRAEPARGPTRDAGSARGEAPPSRAERNASPARSAPTRDAGSARGGGGGSRSSGSGRSR